MARPDITPLHRGVRPIPADHLRSIFEQPRDYAEPFRFVPSPERKVTVVERLGDLTSGWAMPSARAADTSHSSLLRVSTIGGIAIAALCVIYFVAEFMR